MFPLFIQVIIRLLVTLLDYTLVCALHRISSLRPPLQDSEDGRDIKKTNIKLSIEGGMHRIEGMWPENRGAGPNK